MSTSPEKLPFLPELAHRMSSTSFLNLEEYGHILLFSTEFFLWKTSLYERG